MSITVYTDDPAALLAELVLKTKKSEFKTWKYEEKSGFHHTGDGQWEHRGSLKAQPIDKEKNYLILKFVAGTEKMDAATKDAAYGVIHGRFVELIMNHFKNKYDRVVVSDRRK